MPTSQHRPYRTKITVIVLLIGLLLPAMAAGQSITDDFSSYPSGSDASPEWETAGGFWYVADGMVCENGGAYDSGLFSKQYQGGAYEASMRFRIEDGHVGAGFLFSSASASTNAYAHMVRLSDEQIIYGYLEEGAYNSLGDVAAPAGIAAGGWHTFTLRVDPDAGTYGFGIDGETLREDLPLRYQTGYVALENSGGRACFDDFELAPRGSAGAARPAAWAKAVAVADGGEVWVASPASGTVRRLSSDGDVLTDLNATAERPFVEPAAVRSLSGGDVVILDAGASRVHRYSSEGEWIATGGGRLDEPFDIALVGDSTIAVSDPGAGKIFFLDGDLKSVGDLDLEDPYEPGPIAANASMLAFVDLDSGALHVLEGRGTEWARRSTFYMPPGAVRGIEIGTDAVFVAVDRTIRRFDFHGNETAVLDLNMLNRLLPQRLALDGERLYVADFIGDRIIVSDTDLTSPVLSHSFAGKELTLSWESAVPMPTRVEVRVDNELLDTRQGPAGTDHSFTFSDIQPSTLYRVRYTPGINSIPVTSGQSRDIVLMSPPEPGKTHFREIKGAVMLFTNVLDTTAVTDEWPEQPPLPQEEIDRILAQVEDGRRFFWMNSGMRLHLDLDYFVVEEPKEWRDVFVDNSYYPPRTDVTEAVLEENGVELSDYESIFYLVVVRDFDPETGEWDVRGPGGAFTQGLGWNGEYGRSWWEVTREDHASGNNWLVVHEFHHQLDELFMLSGYPEYWFNHFSPHIGTSGRFGEHFDGNAHILRDWPADRYFDLNHGTLAFAPDADGDGIPDRAPDLPMDEVRLGSSPETVDSSGDGMADRETLALSNWITEGVGETYGRPALFPDLSSADTNGNGVVDRDDRHPHFRFTTEIAHGEFVEIGRTDDPRAPHRVEASWTPDSLIIRFTPPADRHLKVLIDANADGWFAGRDNIQFKLETSTMDEQVDAFHAGRSDEWPQMNEDLSESVGESWRRVGDAYQLSIPKNPALGIALDEGEIIGLVFGVSIPEFSRKRQRYVTVHEPNRFIYFRLEGDGAAARSPGATE